jgi:nicotinamide-nucleotide amidase
VFQGGVIAYDNAVKIRELGIDAGVIAEQGAVSEPVAIAMASAVRSKFGATIGIGITGIAGPDGGTPEKPVGTVWVATDIDGQVHAVRGVLAGDRNEIRFRATQVALDRVRRAFLRQQSGGTTSGEALATDAWTAKG